MESVKALIRRYESLSSGRGQWEQHWDDLARMMLPRREGFVTDTIEGDRRTEDIYDGTPLQAARSLANTVGGMMRPEGEDLFFIRAADDEIDNTDEAKEWLADSKERLEDALNNPKARFRQATGEVDADLVVFGTAVMFVGELPTSLLFQSVYLKDAVVFFDEYGNPQGVFRIKRLTLRQAENKFGDALSDETKRKIRSGGLDDKIRMLHCVVPREDGRPDAVLAKNLPFADIWIEYEPQKLVQTGGFHEFPFVVPRWDTSSGEDYGRSPGMIALPDSFSLQAMEETMLVAGQRAADPPLGLPNDGMIDAPNTFPGGLFYYDVETAVQMRGNPFFPLETGSNLPITRDMQDDKRQQVFNAFFRNVLNLPVDGPDMTAAEVILRKEEFIREIGSVFGRLETDYTAPMVERAFNIMLRGGGFAPIPEALQGKNVRFEYESPVKRIKQQIEASAAQLWVRDKVDLAISVQDMSIIDPINFDAYTRFDAQAKSIPYDLILSEGRTEEKRQARAEKMRQQEEMAALEQGVNVAKTGAEAVKTME